jgi:hypothetical protein
MLDSEFLRVGLNNLDGTHLHFGLGRADPLFLIFMELILMVRFENQVRIS